jgi:hypothetical protein
VRCGFRFDGSGTVFVTRAWKAALSTKFRADNHNIDPFSHFFYVHPTPNPMSALSLDQLKQAVYLKEQIAALEKELAAILGGAATASIIPAPASRRVGRPPGGKMSPEARASIAAAQKARWAKFRVSSGAVQKRVPTNNRTISPFHRARIAAAAKARWANYRAQKQK